MVDTPAFMSCDILNPRIMDQNGLFLKIVDPALLEFDATG